MVGYGYMIWQDGRKYEGQFKNGKRHGFGIFTFASGKNEYRGWHIDGKRDGYGIYTSYEEQKTRKCYGKWKDNERIEIIKNEKEKFQPDENFDKCLKKVEKTLGKPQLSNLEADE